MIEEAVAEELGRLKWLDFLRNRVLVADLKIMQFSILGRWKLMS